MTLNWFRLRFKTTCAKCRDELEEGDWAAYSKEEPDQLVCKPCGKEEEDDAAIEEADEADDDSHLCFTCRAPLDEPHREGCPEAP